jgi:nitronate monooxygenase
MTMSSMNEIRSRLSIPVIVAPMFLVSTPAMVIAACREGLLGSFPAHGTRSVEVFESWLIEIIDALKRAEDAGERPAPFAVNLVVHASNARAEGDLALCEKYKVPVILSSKSAPGAMVKRVHAYGGVVMHDIASQRHAEKALEAGVDGLIAVAGGSGGHCGTINPFSLLNEVRRIFQGPVALAGGMSTGRDALAAQAMGADFAYFGTRFIATQESSAAEGQKQMILASNATDIFFSASIDGAPANWLTHSLIAAGIDLDGLRTTLPGKIVASDQTRKRWKDIWTAGHGVGNIDDIPTTQALCRRLKAEYAAARGDVLARLGAASPHTAQAALTGHAS